MGWDNREYWAILTDSPIANNKKRRKQKVLKMKKVLIQKRMFVYETDQYDCHADTEDDDQDD